MREGLLSKAPASLRPALECLRSVNEGKSLVVDMSAADDRGLVLSDFDACAKFLFGVVGEDERAKERMLVKLLGPEWDNRFPKNETFGDQQCSLLALAALACVTAGGRKIGIIGASAPG